MTAPVAIVTGAAGQLGQRIAANLQRGGSTVVGMDRISGTAGGPFAGWCTADQTDRLQVDAELQRVSDEFGEIRVVVANAGYAKFGAWMDMDPGVFERHVSVNLVGTFHVIQSSARLMASHGHGGSVVVISSSMALGHADQVGPYCVTKSAILDLTRSMAGELGVHGVRINAVLPGVIETAMTTGMLAEPGVAADLVDRTPLLRLGNPDDVAGAVAYLASDQAAWITGAALSVDGGQSIYGQPQWIRQSRPGFNAPEWVPGLGGA